MSIFVPDDNLDARKEKYKDIRQKKAESIKSELGLRELNENFLVSDNLIALVIPTPPMSWGDSGWGNGYVGVPPNNPFYKMHYNELYDDYAVDIHGGITFSNYLDAFKGVINVPSEYSDWWVFGWDTRHLGDTLQRWPREEVIIENLNFAHQIVNAI